jgi:hypothetical protein
MFLEKSFICNVLSLRLAVFAEYSSKRLDVEAHTPRECANLLFTLNKVELRREIDSEWLYRKCSITSDRWENLLFEPTLFHSATRDAHAG